MEPMEPMDWDSGDFADAYPDHPDVDITSVGGQGTVSILTEIHGPHHYAILRIRTDSVVVDVPLSAAAAATLGAQALLVAGRCRGMAGAVAVGAMEGDLRHPPRVWS